jgi:hypothetical protein
MTDDVHVAWFRGGTDDLPSTVRNEDLVYRAHTQFAVIVIFLLLLLIVAVRKGFTSATKAAPKAGPTAASRPRGAGRDRPRPTTGERK